MGETVQAELERLHTENCLVCSPECKPNADRFVNGLYSLFDPRPPVPKLLKAMKGDATSSDRAVSAVRSRSTQREMR